MQFLPPVSAELNLPITMVVPEAIGLDPATFQYRHSKYLNHGINTPARFTGNWDDAKHGAPLLVYEYRNGERYVVDGHHRLEFAHRLKARESSSAPKFLAAQILRQADGITPEHAKIIGAFRNIERYGVSEIPDGEKLLEASEMLRSVMQQPMLASTLPPLPQTDELMLAARAGTLGDEAFHIASTKLPTELAVPLAAHTATRDMPEADKVEVLQIMANFMQPMSRPLPC